ncbi:ice-binding family protein [Cellulomonas sp. JZ18]|uniref:ice-binding family protein n=1 Tax=Cellulomonas sp. JZ18 TaxID=2654191 RepID=UPI001E395C42|nr:ice-binding family protein [Cellulomonas sp. JZ18]
MLGTVAECYLVLVLALTAIAVVPLALGWQGSVVQTGSMRPHVNPGDVVLSTALPADSPVPLGGVVQFRTAAPGGGERTVLHRIVAPAEEQGEWVTAGDANHDVDSSTLSREDITGQARLLVRWVGLPSVWLRTGELAWVAAWVALTLAAVAVRVWSWPRREDEDAPTPSPGAGAGPPAPALGRRTFLAAALAVTAGGTVLAGREPVWAGFTARTATAGNTFRVGTWPTLALGRVASFALLAATRVANEAPYGIGSSVVGSVGVSPGTTVSGFWSWDITGSVERNTATARNARADALALYDTTRARAATRAASTTVTGTLPPGVAHRNGPVHVTGTLTLDARGDASAVFVITGTSVTFTAGSSVVLVNGASADRVLFLGTSTVTVSEGAYVRGVVLANGDVSLVRATVAGRVVSTQGAVLLRAATIAAP